MLLALSFKIASATIKSSVRCEKNLSLFDELRTTIILVSLLLSNTTTMQQQQETALAQTTKEDDFLTYENYTYAIRIQYPSDWERLEFNQRDSLNIVVIFRSPPENSSDTKLENFLIQVGNLPFQNIPLDEVVDANINNLKQSLIDFELIELNATTLSGNNPAYKVVYTNREGEDEHKTMQVLSIKEDKAYLLTYIAEKRKYLDYLPIIEKMIDSFGIVTYNGDALTV
jgi:PsbP-like protein